MPIGVYIRTKEIKEKIRQGLLKRWNSKKGLKLKKKFQKAFKGKNNPMYGKKRPDLSLRNHLNPLKDEKHPRWKGDNAGYVSLHHWIWRKLGKATYCSIDKNHKANIYHWANISGEYKRDLSDWRQLCPKCNKNDGVKRAKKFLKWID